jgi:superfamily II DNA or RNA helicase
VLHTEARAAEKLQAFTRSSERWLVAVNMVSEGVDIPRLRVGVYATAAKTPLIFRQIVGRFVRTLPGRPLEPSWLFLPADPVLRAHAAEVERELRHVLRPPSEADGFALDEVDERRQGERDEAEAFVPVAADVAPQMALFGGGPPPPTRAFPSALDEPDEATMPAFERRARLRDKRHRLVADLRRSQGGSHAEINRWLNRSCGVRRVEDASIEQLERSIELLLGRLSGRR